MVRKLAMTSSTVNLHRAIPGECKDYMTAYMGCLKTNKNDSTPCRPLSKNYLDCRMRKCVCLFIEVGRCMLTAVVIDRRGLMEKDEWQNLGFKAEPGKEQPAASTGSAENGPSSPSK